MTKNSGAALLVLFAIGAPSLGYAQNYDEKFEITDPTFEQRSKQERALEDRQSVESITNFKSISRKRNKTIKTEDSLNLFDY